MKICDVEGCGKRARTGSAAYCGMHYTRMYTHGTLEKPKPQPYLHSSGYVHIAGKRQHRVVYREHYGDDLPDCWGCGRPLSWDMGRRMHIDHINKDKTDNRIENLRASCFLCNLQRSPSGGSIMLEIGDRRMCIKNWAKEPDVLVCTATIHRRLKKGASAHEAVFGAKKTHKNTVPKC